MLNILGGVFQVGEKSMDLPSTAESYITDLKSTRGRTEGGECFCHGFLEQLDINVTAEVRRGVGGVKKKG